LSALRQTLFPRWRVAINVEGRDNIDGALAAGSGVLLWVADTVSGHHEFYQGLRDAGLQTVHIGRPTHGMSRTRFGIRWINPLRQRLEQRACRDFVTIDRGSTRRGVAKLKEHLHDNHIVSIRVGDQAARVIRVPFANGRLRLANGPFRIAHEVGAPILPLYVSGRISKSITISIGPPLPLASLQDTDVILAATAYVEWLSPRVQADPGAWRSWPIVEATGSLESCDIGGQG
jgi:lauroyl/myristoyl acyltransferase